MRQASLQKACDAIVTDLDGALACALVDLETGLPLAFKCRPEALSAGALEMLAAAGVSYFNQGRTPGDAVEEVQTTTDDSYHFMSRVPGEATELLILITDREATNLGLGWMSMRQALAEVRDVDLYDEDGAPANRPGAQGTPATDDERVFSMRTGRRRSIWD